MRCGIPAVPCSCPVAADDLADVVDVLIDNVFAHTPEGTPFEVSSDQRRRPAVPRRRRRGPGLRQTRGSGRDSPPREYRARAGHRAAHSPRVAAAGCRGDGPAGLGPAWSSPAGRSRLTTRSGRVGDTCPLSRRRRARCARGRRARRHRRRGRHGRRAGVSRGLGRHRRRWHRRGRARRAGWRPPPPVEPPELGSVTSGPPRSRTPCPGGPPAPRRAPSRTSRER